jgi:hypothetical protein
MRLNKHDAPHADEQTIKLHAAVRENRELRWQIGAFSFH